MEEIWLDVKGYEGLYQISNYGRVKSMDKIDVSGHHRKEKLLRYGINKHGHLHVKLCKNGNAKYPQVHQLVAQAFIPNPENKTDVHHIDHDKTNNRVENLMWVTPKQHADLHPERFEKAAKVHSKLVSQFTNDGQFVVEYPSAHEASRKTGISRTSICKCCIGQQKYAGGFIWKYVDDI